MLLLDIVLTLMAAYFAKQAYDDGHIEWAMFWSVLLGWDIHTLVSVL